MSGILKDEDFMGIEQTLAMSQNECFNIQRQLASDVEFFLKKKIIDYSMLVAVVNIFFSYFGLNPIGGLGLTDRPSGKSEIISKL
jgi:hypothetical protein